MKMRRWYDPQAEYDGWLEQAKKHDEAVCLDEALLDAQTVLVERSKDTFQVWDWPFDESTLSKMIFEIALRGRLTAEDKRLLNVLAIAFAGLDKKWSLNLRRKGRKPIMPLQAVEQLETRNAAIATKIAWMLHNGYKMEAAVASFHQMGLERAQVFAIWAKYKDYGQRHWKVLEEPIEKPKFLRGLVLRLSEIYSTVVVGRTKK